MALERVGLLNLAAIGDADILDAEIVFGVVSIS